VLAPCEVAVKCLLPSVRAMLAKELMVRHNLRQAEAAQLLGVSQPAVSLYYRKRRGRAIELQDDNDIAKLIDDLADSLSAGNVSHRDFVSMFCRICKTTRAKQLLCKMHKSFDASIDIEKCGLCLRIDP
jgi:predicted transcriptional regulator